MIVTFTSAELAALVAVFTNAERVHWAGYDAAKQRVLDTAAMGARYVPIRVSRIVGGDLVAWAVGDREQGHRCVTEKCDLYEQAQAQADRLNAAHRDLQQAQAS